MTTTGDVNISIDDGGGSAVNVPAQTVQLVIGCSSAGTKEQILSTRSLQSLTGAYGYGPLCEAAGLVLQAGGTVLAMKCDADDVGAIGAVQHTGTGSSTMTVTPDDDLVGAFDAFFVSAKVTKAGTLGTDKCQVRLSLDAGRTYGPAVVLPIAGNQSKGGETSSSNAFPAVLADGDTFLGKVDEQSAQTLTIHAAQATKTGSGATFAAVTAGHTLTVAINGVAGNQVLTFAGTENSEALFMARINAQIEGAYVADASAQIKFFTDVYGSSAGGSIVAGDADVRASLGLTTGAFTAGSNNVANVDAVTAAELGGLFDSTFTHSAGVETSVNADGSLTIQSATPGPAPNGFQFSSGTGVSKISGFNTSEHNGGATDHSIAIPQTGFTVHFGAGALVEGDTYQFYTSAPPFSQASVEACMAAFLASQYASVGVPIVHVAGVASAAQAAIFQSGSPGVNELAAGFVFARLITSARDAAVPTAWGGGGETEGDWMTAVLDDFADIDAKRVVCTAGFYNMPTAISNPLAGVPRYRRPLSYALAARQVGIPPQRHAGRVKQGSDAQGGALQWVTIDSVNDPKDGFVYHDERINPGFDRLQGGPGRFCSARTRIGRPGLFVVNPLLLSAPGSDFTLLPLGLVIDIACSIVHQIGELEINNDIRTNDGKRGAVGTIYENDARRIEAAIGGALDDQMLSKGMISGRTVTIDRSNNVLTSSTLNIAVSIVSRGYVLQETVVIGFQNANAAAA